jgi:hypothetical protein
MFLLDHIAQYPPQLRSHIPALLCLLSLCGESAPPGALFQILILGASNSAEEQTKFLNLDKRLLSINKAWPGVYDHTWKSLFQDKSRAGEYIVDGESFVALAKAIVSVIYSKYAAFKYCIIGR